MYNISGRQWTKKVKCKNEILITMQKHFLGKLQFCGISMSPIKILKKIFVSTLISDLPHQWNSVCSIITSTR